MLKASIKFDGEPLEAPRRIQNKTVIMWLINMTVTLPILQRLF